MVNISHETLNSLPALNEQMKVAVDMSSLDLAIVAMVMVILRFFRYRLESEPARTKEVEKQPVEFRPQEPQRIPPFKLYITPPSTPTKDHTDRESAEISSSATAVSHQAETGKRQSSSSHRSFPLSGQSSKKIQDAAPPSPPPSSSSEKSVKSRASTESDGAGKPIKRRSTQEDSAFNSFKRLCEAHGLLKRPAGLGEHDVDDGINDEATLLCVSFHSSNQTLCAPCSHDR